MDGTPFTLVPGRTCGRDSPETLLDSPETLLLLGVAMVILLLVVLVSVGEMAAVEDLLTEAERGQAGSIRVPGACT